MLVAERILTIDEEEIESVAEAEVLEAIVQEKGIGLVVPDGMASRFDPVRIHQDGHARKIACEHEGLVPGLGGIEKDRFSV
jgi:DNA transposition AAA+ family ATPase